MVELLDVQNSGQGDEPFYMILQQKKLKVLNKCNKVKEGQQAERKREKVKIGFLKKGGR